MTPPDEATIRACESLNTGKGREIHRRRVERLLKQLGYIASDAQATVLRDNLEKLILIAKNLYSWPEIEALLPSYPKGTIYSTTYKERTMELFLCTQALLDYIDSKIGNPVAQEYLSGALNEAEKALNDGYVPCAAIMTRVALEQTLKVICESHQVEYSHKWMAGELNDALKKAGVFEKYYWRNVQSKIDFLGAPAHDGKPQPEDKIRSHITWVENFIDKWLSGGEDQQTEEAEEKSREG